MDNLYTVEIWKDCSIGTEEWFKSVPGEWVYTLKSNVYSIAREHKEFLESMGHKARLTPEELH